MHSALGLFLSLTVVGGLGTRLMLPLLAFICNGGKGEFTYWSRCLRLFGLAAPLAKHV